VPDEKLSVWEDAGGRMIEEDTEYAGSRYKNLFLISYCTLFRDMLK